MGEGKNLTEKSITKTQKNKKTKKTRTVTKKIKTRSFLSIFDNYTQEMMDEEEEDNANADEDYEPANVYVICDEVEQIAEAAPYGLEYYLDCKHEEEFDDGMGMEDIDEEDEEDDDEDDEPVQKKGRKD